MNVKRLKLQLGAAVLVAALSIGTVGAVRMNSQAKARTVAIEKQADSDRAVAVLDQMYAAYTAMHSFKCSVTSREDILGTAQDATYETERPNKVRFHRATLLGELSGQALAVSDGANAYVTCTEKNGLPDRYAKMPADRFEDIMASSMDFYGLPGWGTEAFAGMPSVALGVKPGQDRSLSAPEYSMGQPITLDSPAIDHVIDKHALVDVITVRMHWLAPVGTIKDDPEIVTYYIGHADHLLYKLTAAYMVSPTEWDTRTETIIDMEINKAQNPADFVFTPPPGSHEVSDTSDLFPGGKM